MPRFMLQTAQLCYAVSMFPACSLCSGRSCVDFSCDVNEGSLQNMHIVNRLVAQRIYCAIQGHFNLSVQLFITSFLHCFSFSERLKNYIDN
jgi:hypothetical protein